MKPYYAPRKEDISSTELNFKYRIPKMMPRKDILAHCRFVVFRELNSEDNIIQQFSIQSNNCNWVLVIIETKYFSSGTITNNIVPAIIIRCVSNKIQWSAIWISTWVKTSSANVHRRINMDSQYDPFRKLNQFHVETRTPRKISATEIVVNKNVTTKESEQESPDRKRHR